MISVTASALIGTISGIVIPGIAAYVHSLIRIAKLEARLDAKDEHLNRIEVTLNEIRNDIKRIR